MEKCITKLSNNECINLTNLSVEDLIKLQYEEECWAAEKILELPPFSVDRNTFMAKAYEFVNTVMDECFYKQHGRKAVAWGASKVNAKLLAKLVLEKLKKNNTGQTVLYEAGVGMGFSIKYLLSFLKRNYKKTGKPECSIKGCDIVLSPDIIKLYEHYPEVEIIQGNVYDCIKKIPDNSIDIFYADNVFEHFCPDEIEAIICEIDKKLKPDAFVFLIIPNKFAGPFDVSKHFLPFGSKAKGFHFMEMSFNDVTIMMNKYNINHSHCVFQIPKLIAFCVRSKFLVKMKLKLETVFAKIPFPAFSKLMFSIGGFSRSIMKKDSEHDNTSSC